MGLFDLIYNDVNLTESDSAFEGLVNFRYFKRPPPGPWIVAA